VPTILVYAAGQAGLTQLKGRVVRDGDSFVYDVPTASFLAAPTSPYVAMPEGSTAAQPASTYPLALSSLAPFTDGTYSVFIHDGARSDLVVKTAQFQVTAGQLVNQSYPDPWATTLPGSYAGGQAGHLLTQPVTLAAGALSNVVVEGSPQINLLEAVQLMASVIAGGVSVVNDELTFLGVGNVTTRAVVQGDPAGNRKQLTLYLPGRSGISVSNP
jgi:hypothetical protein